MRVALLCHSHSFRFQDTRWCLCGNRLKLFGLKVQDSNVPARIEESMLLRLTSHPPINSSCGTEANLTIPSQHLLTSTVDLSIQTSFLTLGGQPAHGSADQLSSIAYRIRGLIALRVELAHLVICEFEAGSSQVFFIVIQAVAAGN